jgi:NAD(P)-dependent dehydrogenase (short-subunit alcohol dehydrogenase family)
MPELDGQVAIVAGGGSGIGRATALALARDGAGVAVFDVNETGARETVAQVEAQGGRGLAIQVDVAAPEQVEAAVARVATTLGGPDILVNTAALEGRGTLFELTVEEFQRTIGVNLVGSFITCQAAARRMIPRNYGRIVNFASGHWFRPGPGTTAYAASKAGVVMMSRVLAQELAPHGILVNTIAPGLTDTPMTRPYWKTDEDMRTAASSGLLANLFGRPLQPEELADAVTLLVGPRARAITGQTLHVNAGSFMW